MSTPRTEPVAHPRSEEADRPRSRRRNPTLRLRWTDSPAGLAARWSVDEQ